MMQLNPPEAQPNRECRVRPLRVGRSTLDCNLVLAPMAGVTNLPFRLIAREAGAALVFTETVSAKGLSSGGAKSWRLVDHSPREAPLAYQLFGSCAQVLGEATRMLVERGAEFVDLNLGCPVKKFIRNGAGSALLQTPHNVGPLVASMRQAIPNGVLSVKMRLGWDSRSITAPEVAAIAESEGADFVSVHGRTRAQLYSGQSDRAGIARVVDAVRIPVFANGDVVAAHQALELLDETKAAGVMIGRGAMNNPWIFSQIIQMDRGYAPPRPSPSDRAKLVERHLGMMLEYFKDSVQTVHMLKKYLCAYSTGMEGSSRFRERINRSTELESVIEDANRFFGVAA